MTDPDPGSGQQGASATLSPAIRTMDLAKRYDRVVALSSLTMTVPRGEIFGFLGPNGAGKTTAVKLMLGLTHPTSGEAFVLGMPLGDREVRRAIGYLPELFRYQDWLCGREVLDFHCSLLGIPRASRGEEIERTLDTVGLASRALDRVGTYSKGMQQRLGLAVALVGSPRLIFLDEPTSALDPVGRREVREVLRGLKRRGVTVFLNSHLLTEVEQVCDRVAIVDRGRVIAMGTLDALMQDGFSLRIKVRTVAQAHLDALAAFGRPEIVEGSYLVHGVDPDSVPEIVESLVRIGAGIVSVQPARRSLEEHFLDVLRGSADAAARDR
jgi:ABC-2 type transport system ATP-binding protein